jgi:hypothetical protein
VQRKTGGRGEQALVVLASTVGGDYALAPFDSGACEVLVPVQAVRLSPADAVAQMATTLTDKTGRFAFVNLHPGKYQLRCQTATGTVLHFRQWGGISRRGANRARIAQDEFSEAEAGWMVVARSRAVLAALGLSVGNSVAPRVL